MNISASELNTVLSISTVGGNAVTTFVTIVTKSRLFYLCLKILLMYRNDAQSEYDV